MRYMSDGVRPTDSLGTATAKLAAYDDIVMHERNMKCYDEWKETKLHTTRWGRLLTTFYIGGIIKEQEKLAGDRNYIWEYDSNSNAIHIMASPINSFRGNAEESEFNDDESLEEDSLNNDDETLANLVHEHANPSTKHSLKQVKKMKMGELFTNMAEEEKTSVEMILTEYKGIITTFHHVRTIPIIVVGDKVYLSCTCGFHAKNG